MITSAQLAALYDVAPIEVTFIGGVAHGLTTTVPDDRESYVMPVMTRPLIVAGTGEDTAMPVTQGFDLYRRIMIRDDGVRVFRHCPAESRR